MKKAELWPTRTNPTRGGRRLVVLSTASFLVGIALLLAGGSLSLPGGEGPGGHEHTAFAQTQPCSTKTPLGALPPTIPIWCHLPLTSGPATAIEGPNSWVDDFDHGLSNASFAGAGYRVFDNPDLTQSEESAGAKIHPSITFRHANHWMADVKTASEPGGQNNGYGGTYLRPDRTFRFEDGRFVVEFDFAAGILEYRGNNWGEVIVTTGPRPDSATHGFTLTDTDGFSNFRGHWTFGMRLKPSRDFNDSFIINDDLDPATLKRPDYQRHLYARVGGGGPWTAARDAAYRTCNLTDPDIHCRDRFRIEFDKNADMITWYVNGVQYHRAQVPLPTGLTEADLYVYFVSWVYRNAESVETTRFHWDRLAINPSSSPQISGVKAVGTTGTDATIEWTTNEAADSQVEYGTTTAYGSSTPLDSNRVTSHAVHLSGLTANTTYHYRVKSTDAIGNPAVSEDSTFTTAKSCPCSIWDGTATPQTASASDTRAVELGVKFRASQDGYITGVRFYKGTANGGTHVGNLWSATGTQLASATFTNETASGWQQVEFAAPVPVTANTTYIASYHAPQGGYARDTRYFTSQGVTSGPLTALASGVDGENGVYQYGPAGTFPSSYPFNNTNYWVDVVFDGN